MEANNTFNGGMNSDISKLLQANNEYVKALNFRGLNTQGGSNGALVNIKGNECAVTFPVARGIYKLRIKPVLIGDVFQPGTIAITINGQTTINYNITANTTTQDIFNLITTLTNCAKNSNPINPTFSVAYNTEEIVIFQNPTYSGCDVQTSYEPVVIPTPISDVLTTSTLELVNKDGAGCAWNSLQSYLSTSMGNDFVIIGSTFIHETFYLFTVPLNPLAPQNTGQIWEMSYDEITRTTSITLIYNNYLTFSFNTPIAPTAAIGRYELDSIQRIYWTDFSNPVRTMNVKDPNVMALGIDLIDLTSAVNMSVPTLSNIIDGGADSPLPTAATYQCAYRLVKNNGGMTNYSTLSNIVYLTPQAINGFNGNQTDFAGLAGDDTTVNKAIEWTVEGIDTDYDVIEFVVIQRFSPNETIFGIYQFDSQVISGNETMSAIYRNQEDVIPITQTEFLLENIAFTHAKTIEQKDNRLFFGNVKDSLSDYLDSFDTRAFRFRPNSNIIDVLKYESDVTTTQYIINNNNWDDIPLNADNIGLYNLGLEIADNPSYSDALTNQQLSVIIGGTGPNISYKFGSQLIRSDATPLRPLQPNIGGVLVGTTRDNNISSQAYRNGYRIAGTTNPYTGLNPFENGEPFQTYPQNNIKQSMGMEYLSGNLKSYQHNEIYRFAIVFYSKTVKSSFAKWIGDIKFPNYSHPVDFGDPSVWGVTDDGQYCTDHRSMFYTSNGAYCNLPYIKFTVNIPPELAALISGYEIVRVKRDRKDMSIPTTGLLNQIQFGYNTIDTYLPVSHSYNVSAGGSNEMSPAGGVSNNNGYTHAGSPNNVFTFHPYDYLCDQNTNNIEENDKIVITEKYYRTHQAAVNPGSAPIGGGIGYEQYYYITKYYTLASNGFIFGNGNYSNAIVKIKKGYYIPQDGQSPNLINIPGTSYRNRDWESNNPANQQPGNMTGNAYAQGCPTILLETISPYNLTWLGFNANGYNVAEQDANSLANSKLLAIHFKPNNLSTQYGGRGYVKRANNKYISTGSYYSVREPGTTSIEVFGGDIYHGIIDIQKAIKNWTNTSAATKHSQTWFYPTQSIYNVDLRQGLHVNADLNQDNGAGGSASELDQYGNYPAYNYENTLRYFYPKPLFFNETDTWNNRIYWSEVKINGENSDSWTVIPIDNYHDVEGNYGPINALTTLNDQMYSVQDRALARLLVNPQALMTDQSGIELKLGSGATLNKHNYVSIDAGSKHQWSVSRSPNHITFVDVRTKKIYLFDGQSLNPISDTKGNRNFIQKVLHDNILTTDNPIVSNGILTTYDYQNNEFLYTFRNYFMNVDLGDPNKLDDEYTNEYYTLSYSDMLQRFGSFYSFTPYIYINNNSKLYSPRNPLVNTPSKLYMHDIGAYGKFYDTLYPSTLTVNINNNPLSTKVFDNLSWYTESIKDYSYRDSINNYLGDSDNVNYLTDTFKRVRMYNEYQNTDWVNLAITNPITTLRKSEQGYNVQVPRNKVNLDINNINSNSIFDTATLTKTSFGDRLRDKYMVVDLEYDNVTNSRFIVHNLKSSFRVSDR